MQTKRKILIVDDESRVRRRIASQIAYRDYFELAGEASNGLDALEFIENNPVDVLFTDIRMPYSDGIDLTRRIRRDYPTIKVAFISGYDDFKYAKEAIDLNVVTFLEKPVMAEDIDNALKQIKAAIEHDLESFYNEKRLKETYRDSRPLLLENQFTALLQSQTITDAMIKRFELFDVDLTKGEFNVAYVAFKQTLDFQTLEKTRVFLINLISRLLQKFNQHFHFNTMNGLGIVINAPRIDGALLEETLNEIIARTKDYQPDAITIGVSDTFKSFKYFTTMFNQAQHTLSYSRYLHTSNLLFYSDVSQQQPKRIMITDEEFSALDYVLKFGTLQEIAKTFQKLEDKLTGETQSMIDQQYYVVHFSSVLMRLSAQMGVELNAFLNEDFLTKVFQFDTINGLFEYIKSCALKLRRHREASNQSQSTKLIEKITGYVDMHYHTPRISLDEISDTFHISVSYLSVLFKKHTGMTFNKYLIKKRMDKAKSLLLNTDKKILEIATDVGYPEVYHFSHSFKKHTGKSPKEYRQHAK